MAASTNGVLFRTEILQACHACQACLSTPNLNSQSRPAQLFCISRCFKMHFWGEKLDMGNFWTDDLPSVRATDNEIVNSLLTTQNPVTNSRNLRQRKWSLLRIRCKCKHAENDALRVHDALKVSEKKLGNTFWTDTFRICCMNAWTDNQYLYHLC